MKKDYDLCMLWQQEKVSIEECLANAFAHYKNKIGRKPKKVYVNSKVEIKVFDGAMLVPDRSMYSAGIIAMVI